MSPRKSGTPCTVLTQCTILALAVFGFMAAMPSDARAQGQGCQAGGSISILPSTGSTCASSLDVNQTKDILIQVSNTSTTVPAPGTPVTAELHGSITHIMACTNTTCTTELPGTLGFVAVNANGCVSNAAGVAGCAASGTNRVIITMTAAGVPLNLTGATTIATIRVRALVPVAPPAVCGVFGERSDTGVNDLVTNDATCETQATGGAQGSTNENFPPPPTVDITKTCVNGLCTDNAITFTVRVTNTGSTALATCTVTDADCSPAPPSITNLAAGAFQQYTCTKPATPGGAGVNNTADVSCTDVNGNLATDTVTSNTCTLPPPPTASRVREAPGPEPLRRDAAPRGARAGHRALRGRGGCQ